MCMRLSRLRLDRHKYTLTFKTDSASVEGGALGKDAITALAAFAPQFSCLSLGPPTNVRAVVYTHTTHSPGKSNEWADAFGRLSELPDSANTFQDARRFQIKSSNVLPPSRRACPPPPESRLADFPRHALSEIGSPSTRVPEDFRPSSTRTLGRSMKLASVATVYTPNVVSWIC